LSEEAGTEIAKSKNAQGFNEVQTALMKWATIAKKAKEELEAETGKTVLDSTNRLTQRQKLLRKEALSQKSSLTKKK
jgi:hypothetical protein